MSAGAAPPQLFNGVPVPPPPGIDLSVDRYPQILISQVVTYVFAFIAFSLRIVSRKCTGVGLWWDDYLVFPAIILATATLGFRSPPHGFGQHVWAVGWDTQSTELLKLFAGEIISTFQLFFLKYSILALYWRVFSISRPMRIAIWTMFGLCSAWLCASIILNCVQCKPLSKFWDLLEPGICFNGPAFYLSGAVTHIILDFILLLMPVSIVWKMQANVSQKLLLIGSFMVGSSAIVFSIFRLTFLYDIDTKSVDLTWNFTDVLIWTLVEANVSIIAVCLPTLRPIYRFLMTGKFTKKPKYSSSRLSRKTRPSGGETLQEGKSSGQGSDGTKTKNGQWSHQSSETKTQGSGASKTQLVVDRDEKADV